MFSKSKKGGPQSSSSPHPVESSPKPAEVPKMANSDPRKNNGVPSIISADLTIDGNVTSDGDIQIDGKVNGDIKTRTLTLGESGDVRGAIHADSVRVCGSVEGEVRATTVILTKSAKVRGDVLHESLAIESGAFIDGHCKRTTGDEIKRREEVKPSAPMSGPTPLDIAQNKPQPSRTSAAE